MCKTPNRVGGSHGGPAARVGGQPAVGQGLPRHLRALLYAGEVAVEEAASAVGSVPPAPAAGGATSSAAT